GIRDFHVTGVQTCALPISAGLEGDARRVPCRLPGREPGHPGEHQRRHPLPGGRRHPGGGGLIMATGQYEVVALEGPTPGQTIGRIALFNADGSPWTGGGDGPAAVAWDDITDKPSTFAPIIGTGANQAAAGNHTHAASTVTATAVAGGTATDVQGILDELAARIADLENPNP